MERWVDSTARGNSIAISTINGKPIFFKKEQHKYIHKHKYYSIMQRVETASINKFFLIAGAYVCTRPLHWC